MNNVRGAVPNVAGVAGTDDFRTIMSNVELNRLAQQIQARNDIVKQREATASALRAELARPNPDPIMVHALQFALNGSNAAVAIPQTRIAGAFAGARTDAQAAASAQRQANTFVGGLTVSVMTNLVSGYAGSAVGGGIAGVATDLTVGGILNYGQAQFQSGTTTPQAGNRAVVTNSLSSLAVGLAEEVLEQKLGPTKEAIKATRGAFAAAGVQAVLDDLVAREDAHNNGKK